MLGVVGNARADTGGPCDAASLTCTTGTAALSGAITQTLPAVIDSGDMVSGPLTIRTKLTIDPTGTDALIAVDMPKGALLKATWTEKGFVNVVAITDASATGSIKAHYTLTPTLSGTIYGAAVNGNATDLASKAHYDGQSQASLLPWGFAPTVLQGTPPELAQSTLLTASFAALGIDEFTAEGTLAVAASANPTFTYSTTSIRLDAATITTVDGVAKLAVGDDDALDVPAQVSGQIVLGGTVDIEPAAVVDSVDDFFFFGFDNYAFSAVSAPVGAGAAPVPVLFRPTTIHLPLPNVKVPTATVGMGTLEAGNSVVEKVSIANTGELGGSFTVMSSDPQFTLPSGALTVGAKSQMDLKITFTPSSNAPATATITVTSNDPGDPVQTFDVAANGAAGSGSNPATPDDDDDDDSDDAKASSGCSTNGASGTTSGVGVAGIALVAVLRRRRKHL